MNDELASLRRRRRRRWRRNLVLDLKSNGCEGEKQVD